MIMFLHSFTWEILLNNIITIFNNNTDNINDNSKSSLLYDINIVCKCELNKYIGKENFKQDVMFFFYRTKDTVQLTISLC